MPQRANAMFIWISEQISEPATDWIIIIEQRNISYNQYNKLHVIRLSGGNIVGLLSSVLQYEQSSILNVRH